MNLLHDFLQFFDYRMSTETSQMSDALKKLMNSSYHGKLEKAVKHARTALLDYVDWIEDHQTIMGDEFSVGRESYEYFLRRIALMPLTPEELLLIGEREWNRSVAFDHYEKLRNATLHEAKLFPDIEAQIKQSKKDEGAIRKFLDEMNIMSVTEWLKHYKNRKMPDYIVPFMGRLRII